MRNNMLTITQKKYFSLFMAILAAGLVIDRIYRLASGKIEWYSLAMAIVILLCFIKFYLDYRKR